jgi:hypothetical protein
MRTRIKLTMLALAMLLTLPLPAQTTKVLGRRITAALAAFSDDFANGVDTWIEIAASNWSEASGVLTQSVTDAGHSRCVAYSATADSTPDTTNTFSQWQCVKIPWATTASPGFVFDVNGITFDSTHRRFYVILDHSDNHIYTGDGTSETEGVDANGAGNSGCTSWAAGNWFCVEWTNTGTTSLTANYYRFTSTPPARGSWGAACGTDSGLTLRAAPTGKGLGLIHYTGAGGASASFDDWSGGDQ